MSNFFKNYPIVDATREDALAYVSILFSIAACDELDSKEAQSIRLLVENNEWDLKIFEEAKNNKNFSLDTISLSSILIEVGAPYLLRDLCAIAYLSNGFSDNEEFKINLVREKLGVSIDLYLKIKKSVISHIESIKIWSEVNYV